MKNITNKKSVLAGAMFVAALSFMIVAMPTPAKADTSALIGSQMGIGSRGVEVEKLQSFLATNSQIYSQGTVSGYYGGLTKAAVEQFQLNYNLPMVGNVGPMTLSKLNALIATGNGLDTFAPILSSLNVQSSSNGATINWTTNERAMAKVFYDTSVLNVQEATMSFAAPLIGGYNVSGGTSLNSIGSVALTGLNGNTNYYYIVQVIDAAGNVTITTPAVLHTN